MRIIGGTAGGRTLVAPSGMRTRPTQDYVRESLFNILRGEVVDAEVLDLFAGSGALALESVSRGAQCAVLVDRAPAAMQAARRNVATLGFDAQCACMGCDWQTALSRCQAQGLRFSLVFLDPPYDLHCLNAVADALHARCLLQPDALLVLEHRHGDTPQLPAPYAQEDARRYGDTGITFFRWEGTADAQGDLPGQL